MAVTDFFAGEIATELLRMLITISSKSCSCKVSAGQLILYLNQLMPIIHEIKYIGVELPADRQAQLDRFSEILANGVELAQKVLNSRRWNVYKNLQNAKKMEKLEQTVARFLNGPMQAHLWADVHRLRFDSEARFDRLDDSARRLEDSARRLEEGFGAMKIGVGGGESLLEERLMRVEEEERCEGSFVNFGVGMGLAKKNVMEMVIGRDDWKVVLLRGLGGCGKTTLAREICRDPQVRSYFNNKVLFLTVSQSPNIEQLRLKIWQCISASNSGSEIVAFNEEYSQERLNPFGSGLGSKTLIVLDDVWSLSELEQLIFRSPGCKILVVSRFQFGENVIDQTHELDLLRDGEDVALFCLSAFGQTTIPPSADEKLVMQVVKECKRLPLALKVVGASLKNRPEMYWTGAECRLSRSEPISESHETKLLDRMAVSIDYLDEKVRECFLDLGSFPEDKKIPLDVLINIWVEARDIEEREAFAILMELSDKNLLTLVKDARAGDKYSSYYEISVTQHDVLRDLALHLSNRGDINERKRLLMPRRENRLPKEWERNMDQPFNAQIVSLHTGEMQEMDWCDMEFSKAEVLILNFSSKNYYLPPFIHNMPKLRSLILINHSTSNAILDNISVFTNMPNLRSIWFEKICVPHLPNTTIPFKKLQKISLILCKINNSLDPSVINVSQIFPNLSELTMDHCVDLTELPPTISKVKSLKSVSVTNCHSFRELPADLGNLSSLEILRVYACPTLNELPSSICELLKLKYIDISQCVNLENLPEEIGRLAALEKIDMRECCQIFDLPCSVESLKSLRRVICDEDVSWLWKEKDIADLHVQVAKECFSLDWLSE